MDNINNVTNAAAPAAVSAVNLSTLAPRDELQPPQSARSTVSGHSWITDDKWSDDDDDDDDDDVGGYMTGGAPAGKVAPPAAILGSHVATGSSSQQINQQVSLVS